MHSPFLQSPPPLGALRHLIYRQPYPGLSASVPAARERFAKAASIGGLPLAVTEIAVVCLSELATNCVVHAGRRFIVASSVRGMRQRFVRLEVHDSDATRPVFPAKEAAIDVLAELDLDATGGRGLAMVAMLADRTGVEPDCNGKTVWFELRLDRSGTNDDITPGGGGTAVAR